MGTKLMILGVIGIFSAKNKKDDDKEITMYDLLELVLSIFLVSLGLSIN